MSNAHLTNASATLSSLAAGMKFYAAEGFPSPQREEEIRKSWADSLREVAGKIEVKAERKEG